MDGAGLLLGPLQGEGQEARRKALLFDSPGSPCYGMARIHVLSRLYCCKPHLKRLQPKVQSGVPIQASTDPFCDRATARCSRAKHSIIMQRTTTMQTSTCMHRSGGLLRSRAPCQGLLRRPSIGARPAFAVSQGRCRRRHPPCTVRAASSAAVLSSEDEIPFTFERKEAPPQLPPPPKGTTLISVMPYLVKLATADRC